ncbi:hypothetical protein [Flavobacterium sp.]|uniref:hypothetical protein n=1 Tax=Flavobacterium sp. TaxID=239 RepID=UPI00286E7564|nr:hypothetical protein [Flavobacterium sp.]
MFDSIALNVVISLVFIYSLYSLLVTTLNEIIASFFSLRAKTLEKGIKRMLTDNGDKVNSIVDQFYQQPLIKYLGEDNTKKPAYLTSASFSSALVHLCDDLAAGAPDTQAQLLTGIKEIKKINPQTGKFLETLYADASGDLVKFQALSETWFNETMDRATGWYKKQTQRITLLVAFIVALSFNVDTIGIVKNLSANPKLATAVVEMADKYLKASKASEVVPAKEADEQIRASMATAQKLVASNSDIQNANAVLGLGWNDIKSEEIFFSVLGCMLTALAISLGAPFWFDLLSKLMQLRGSKKVVETPTK